MLLNLKRWLLRPADAPGTSAARQWADARGAALRVSHGRDGFAIEGEGPSGPWRIEWGPAQRAYLGPTELRIRAETGIDAVTHAVIMNRPLMESLERQVFAQFTDNVQTRLDSETPEEMRWLAMSPKLTSAQLGPLRDRYGAVGNVPAWLQAWLGADLGAALLARPQVTAGAQMPFALLAHRGRIVLRTARAEASADTLDADFALFEVALAEARRTAALSSTA